MKAPLRMTLGLLASAWTAVALAAQPDYRLKVTGLACPFCVYGMEKKLGALPSVERVETHLKEGVVLVTMKGGATLDEAAVSKAVQSAGFTLNGFEPRSQDSGER